MSGSRASLLSCSFTWACSWSLRRCLDFPDFANTAIPIPMSVGVAARFLAHWGPLSGESCMSSIQEEYYIRLPQ